MWNSVVRMRLMEVRVRGVAKVPIRVPFEIPCVREEQRVESRMSRKIVRSVIERADNVEAAWPRSRLDTGNYILDIVGTSQAVQEPITDDDIVRLLTAVEIEHVLVEPSDMRIGEGALSIADRSQRAIDRINLASHTCEDSRVFSLTTTKI